jgi:hypothetical protein
MDLYALFSFISAAFSGALMGSFLLITVIYKPLFSEHLNDDQRLFFYRRFYRLNIALSLLGGVCAALIKNQQAAIVLAIIAVSYVFTNMHIIKGITTHLENPNSSENQRALKSLHIAQNLTHVLQFIGAGYVIYLLNLNY